LSLSQNELATPERKGGGNVRGVIISFIALVLAATGLAAVQSPPIEYGSPAELKGVTKIFIYTGPDLKLRNELRDKIAKKLPALTVTDSMEGADVVLAYAADMERVFAGVYSSSSSTTTGSQTQTSSSSSTIRAQTQTSGSSSALYRKIEYGTGMVVKRADGGGLRLLMNWKGSKKHLLQRGLATRFVDDFIKAYQDANKS
jgi:hypothetical protein